jgi:diguanylate cyclase (GGDEF)-like protein
MLTTQRREKSIPGTVLVVGADPAFRDLARSAFQRDGHDVVLAATGEDGCRVFDHRVPDLVVMDLGLPVVDGYEACERFRTRGTGARIPVLMLTGSDDADAISRAYEAGATDFQTKPVNWQVLRERVRYMLRGKRHADDLQKLADYDGLTGLPNRATFEQRLTNALVRSTQDGTTVAVIFLDLDCFKEINDTLGHRFGDQILRLTGERLIQVLRSGDRPLLGRRRTEEPWAGRFGGDEFSVTVPGLPTPEAATAIADRIRGIFAQPFHLEGHELFVTASIGLSVSPVDGDDADTLLKHADAAMYAAKAVGRNNLTTYRPSMSVRASERLSLAGELRRAVGRSEDLVVHFQPKVDITTEDVVGAEALLRWQHPSRGLLGPLEFLALAEEMGLGPALGDWVLSTALAGSAGWRGRDDKPIPVAVNLANSQFRSPDLLDRLMQTIDTVGLSTAQVEVEITETVALKNQLADTGLLAEFKERGIRTAIDDFGTGQSALGVLRHLRVDSLKIDRTFVRELETDSRDRAIASCIVDMSHCLGMTVIAEGVETQGQLDVLRAMGCDQAQGFLFSRAVPATAFPQLLLDMGAGQPRSRAGRSAVPDVDTVSATG